MAVSQVIYNLTMDSEGRPPVTIDLSTKGSEVPLKDKPFKIKEGSKYNRDPGAMVKAALVSDPHLCVSVSGTFLLRSFDMLYCTFVKRTLQPRWMAML